MNQAKTIKVTKSNMIAMSAVAILLLWVVVCFCSLLPLVLFASFLFNALILGAGLFSSLAQEREKRTIDALRLTQLTSLDILRYKALGEFRAWRAANLGFLVAAGFAALACGGLLSMALALAVSTRCETTSSAVVTGWVTKLCWLVGMPILDYVVEAVLVLSKDLKFFSYLDPAWVFGSVVSALVYETSAWSVVGLLLGGAASVALAYGLVFHSSRMIDTSFESAATLDDRHRHNVYGKKFALNLHRNPFMVRELAWQIRSGAGSWPGYAVFVTLFLAPFLYGLAQQHKAQEVKPVKIVRQSVANPTAPGEVRTEVASPYWHTTPADNYQPAPPVRYHRHLCLSQVMGLPVPVNHTHYRNYNNNNSGKRIVVNEDGKSVLVDSHQVDQMKVRQAQRQNQPRQSVQRTMLQAELDRGLLTGLLLTLLYLFIRGGAFMSGAVTGEKERRAWDQIALTGVTPETYLFGKLTGVLYYPLRQLLYTSPILLLFAVFGGISLLDVLLLVPMLVLSFLAAANIGLLSTTTNDTSHQAQGTALMAAAGLLLIPMMDGGWFWLGALCFLLLGRTALDAGERALAAVAASLWVAVAGVSASPVAAVMQACDFSGYGGLSMADNHLSSTVCLLVACISMALVAHGAFRLSVRTLDEGGSVKA
ncbi:MAG: ABC transporter permease [Vulcanimicrobiota bacterium]